MMLGRIRRGSLRVLNFFLVAAVAVLVLDVLLGVASRYLWGEQVKWSEELATVLLVWVSFLGIAAAFEARAHLGLDFLVGKFSSGARRRCALAAHLFTIAFVIAGFLVGGGELAHKALVNLNILPALQVSDVVLSLPLPVSGVFILIYEISNFVEDWRKPAGAWEEQEASR